MPNNKVNYSKLLDGVQKVIERGEYQEFLKMIKKFKNNYSFRNLLLIYSQNKQATFVKGFCDWNKLGRNLKKNPKSIYIYVPMKIKVRNQIEGQQNVNGKEEKVRNNAGSTETIEGITYKRVAVYDINDTYLKKGSPRIASVESFFNGNITEDLSQDDRVTTLIHELCHCIYEENRNTNQAFAETVAYLVADYFHLDTSKYSFEYMKNWEKKEITQLISLGNKIKDTANEFIEQIKNRKFNQEKIGA